MTRTIFFTLALVVSLQAEAQGPAPDELVRATTNDVLNVIRQDKDIQSGNMRKIAELAEAKVLPNFDFARMTQLAVGKSWREASEAQKEALIREFRTLLVRTYSTSLAQYRNQTIEVKPAKYASTDTEVMVKTLVNQPGGQPIPIDYTLEKNAQGWKAYDIVIDSVSLVTNYRSSFGDEIRKGGIDGLIKTLRERNAKAGEEKPAASKPK